MQTSTIQRSGLLHQLRTERGLSAATVAKRVGVSVKSVWAWDYRRPAWRYMPKLAEVLGIDMNQAVDVLWNEKIGDRCDRSDCGCSGAGKKSLPCQESLPPSQRSNPGNAYMLYVSVACEHCGKVRTYSPSAHEHFRVCRACSHPRKAPWVTLTCRGYKPFNASRATHAKKCHGQISMLRSRIKFYASVNEAEGTYQCNRCAGAVRLMRALKKRLREVLEWIQPGEKFQKVRSLKQLGKLQSELWVPLFDGSRKVHRKKKRRGIYTSRGVRGLCIFCDTILLSDAPKAKPPKCHQRCFFEWQRGQRSEMRRRGPRVTSLQKHWTWAVMHILRGYSWPEIVRESGKTERAVKKGVKFVMAHLPDPQLVGPRFRRRVVLLRELGTPPLSPKNPNLSGSEPHT